MRLSKRSALYYQPITVKQTMNTITLQQVAAFLSDATLIMTSNGTLSIYDGEDSIITIDTTSGTVLIKSI